MGLLIEEPETKIDDAEQELWLRRRVRVPYESMPSLLDEIFLFV